MGPYAVLTREQVEKSRDSTWDMNDAKREMKKFPEATHIVFIRRGNLKINWPQVLPKGYIGYVRASASIRKMIRFGSCDLFGTSFTLADLQKLLCV